MQYIVAKVTLEKRNDDAMKKEFFIKVPIETVKEFKSCMGAILGEEFALAAFDSDVEFVNRYPRGVRLYEAIDGLTEVADTIERELYREDEKESAEEKEEQDGLVSVKLKQEDADTLALIADILGGDKQYAAHLALSNLFRESFVDGKKTKNKTDILKDVFGPERVHTMQYIANRDKEDIMKLVRELVDMGIEEKLDLIHLTDEALESCCKKNRKKHKEDDDSFIF